MSEQPRLPTGIPGLDELINGGLPRHNSYTLKGRPKSGKTVLGIHIQWAALQRGEPCLFISYKETYDNIIRLFESFGCDVYKCMKEGHFGIFDNASIFTGLDRDEIKSDMSRIERRQVAIVDPRDREAYFRKQIEMMDKLGWEKDNVGINVIDSADIRFRFFDEPERRMPEEVMQYFNKFRTRFGKMGQIGLHILTPIEGEERFGQMLEELEGGTIELDLREENGELRRYIRFYGIPYTDHDRRWHRFAIKKSGIIVGIN